MASAGGSDNNGSAGGNNSRPGGQHQQRIQFTIPLPQNIQPGQRVAIRLVPQVPGQAQQVIECVSTPLGEGERRGGREGES